MSGVRVPPGRSDGPGAAGVVAVRARRICLLRAARADDDEADGESAGDDHPANDAAPQRLCDGQGVLLLWQPAFGKDGSVRCACGKANCASIGKHPIPRIHPRGLNSALLAERDGELRLERGFSKYPNANYGIATRGLAVLDLVRSRPHCPLLPARLEQMVSRPGCSCCVELCRWTNGPLNCGVCHDRRDEAQVAPAVCRWAIGDTCRTKGQRARGRQKDRTRT